jgi:cytochrome c oxidase subunit IV
MSEHHEHAQNIGTIKEYVIVYLALLAGVGLQIVASYHNLGIFNPILALTIAIVQAGLVVLFPMHIKNGSKLSQLSIFSGMFIFMILLGMVFMDYFTRAWGSW